MKEYVVYCEKGHWISLISGDPSFSKEAAKSVAKYIRKGYQVERVEIEKIRAGEIVACSCDWKGRTV